MFHELETAHMVRVHAYLASSALASVAVGAEVVGTHYLRNLNYPQVPIMHMCMIVRYICSLTYMYTLSYYVTSSVKFGIVIER